MEISALLVDDQDDIRRMLQLVIRAARRGVVVVGEAASGQEALACLDDLDPAVVVLDQMMPGLTGLETAGRILARRPEQRILMMSASADERLVRSALELGVTACISKDRLIGIADAICSVAAA